MYVFACDVCVCVLSSEEPKYKRRDPYTEAVSAEMRAYSQLLADQSSERRAQYERAHATQAFLPAMPRGHARRMMSESSSAFKGSLEKRAITAQASLRTAYPSGSQTQRSVRRHILAVDPT